jgi:hypothetical protein
MDFLRAPLYGVLFFIFSVFIKNVFQDCWDLLGRFLCSYLNYLFKINENQMNKTRNRLGTERT